MSSIPDGSSRGEEVAREVASLSGRCITLLLGGVRRGEFQGKISTQY